MHAIAVTGALVLAAVNVIVGAWGGLRWWVVRPEPRFWPALRVAQGLAVVYAVLAGVLYIAGLEPGDGLFWLYVLLPIPVSFVAEQLRLLSAQTVLDARGIEDAKAVAGLPEEDQRSVVRQILRREMGVMALSALVVCFLALRAAGTV